VNSAEYRTLREACGLSQQAAAAFHGVAVRTITHWETGRNNIPSGAAEEIERLNANIERAVLDTAKTLKSQHGEPHAVALTRYRTDAGYAGGRAAAEGLPHCCHNALVGRAKIALERLGASVSIVWGD
jgi:transcriptional regulator with XRE-family HTH domain